MKLPRDITAQELIKAMKKLGYKETQQSGSHIRLTTVTNGEHHITVPNHKPLKPVLFLQLSLMLLCILRKQKKKSY